MGLAPREWQTLEHLLAGRSEKEAAAAMRLSVNTLHHYTKQLHERFGVQTRAELLARFVPQVTGQHLKDVVVDGQLFTRPATAVTWARLCARTGRKAGRLSGGNGGGEGRLSGSPRQPLTLRHGRSNHRPLAGTGA